MNSHRIAAMGLPSYSTTAMDISARSPTCGPYPRIPSSPNPTRTRRPGNTTPLEITGTEMPVNLSTLKLNCCIPTGGQHASHDLTSEHAPLLGAKLRNPHAAPIKPLSTRPYPLRNHALQLRPPLSLT
eukprot:UN3342